MDVNTWEELAKMIVELKRENDQLKQEVEDLRIRLKPTTTGTHSTHGLISEGRK